MKYGLLITSPISKYKNIGDYVQSLAAKHYFDGEYCYVEKEAVSEFNSDEPVKVIMNAWYMWHPECWPPKPCIQPLLISMHISNLTAKEMLANGGKEYLINHGPVGCRDLDTKKILDEAGVPSFFSACLTLTLGETYKYNGERKGVIFVDPFIPPLMYIVNQKKKKYYPLNLLSAIVFYLYNSSIINTLIRRHKYFHSRHKLVTLYNASMFYKIYSSRFSDDVIVNAEFIHHIVPVDDDDNNDTLLAKAEKLVMKYARASYVVTSRIHCALPCLGLETPLMFVLSSDMNSKDNMYNAPGRFGGLVDLFRVLSLHGNTLVTDDEELNNYKKFENGLSFHNKSNWKSYRDSLVKECKEFIKM